MSIENSSSSSKTNSNVATDVTETLVTRLRQELAVSEPNVSYWPTLRELLSDAADALSFQRTLLNEASGWPHERNELRATISRLNRRCQIAEAAANLKVEEWDKRSKGAGRAYIYELAQCSVRDELIAAKTRAEAAEQERDEAKQALGDAARELNIAGPVAQRIKVYKELSRELVDKYRTSAEAAAAENKALKAQLETAQQDILAKLAANYAAKGYREPGLLSDLRAALTASPSDPPARTTEPQ